MYLLSHSDIQNKDLELVIASELSKANNFIYLTATQNMKNMRADSPYLTKCFSPFKQENATANLFSVTEFVQHISKQAYESREYLSNADQRFILAKVIGYYYAENSAMQKTMYQMRYDLYELYKLLAFHNTQIAAERITLIGKDYSCIEKDIFNLYSIYQAVIEKLIAYISCGKSDELLTGVLGDNFLKSTKPKTVKTFTDKQKEIISEHISKVDILVFDGFLFLNEIQRFVLSTAIREGKSVYFISKQFSDRTGDFIFEKNIKDIAEQLSTKIENIPIASEDGNGTSALNHIKATFPNSIGSIPDNPQDMIADGSIEFIRPFISREEELRYVAKAISKRLRDSYTGDINEIIRMINNDVAIVLAIDKENYEERISSIFREVGLFVFKQENLERCGRTDVDVECIEPVYFNRQNFLDSEVRTTTGDYLSYQDKHIIFDRCFMRIDINRNARPISSYPVGQFVLELYRTISEGLSIEGFKGILYSNWRYTVDKIQVKWSDFISDFKYIEIFFEKSKNISEWCNIATGLVSMKKEIEGNYLFDYHPLSQIKSESLDFFCLLLTELKGLNEQINGVVGSIDNHLNTLKSVVMQAGNILDTADDDLEFEQIILKRLALAISDIGASSLMSNLDSNYFAQNIRAMLTDWEQQSATETENTIRLNVVNLENMKKYKYSYFIMCEADKYPRRYFDRFPFTADIINIMQSPKYGIEVTPHEVKGLDYHLELERYLFKNVLDFTTDQLIITHCEKEGGEYNKPSIFVVDIASAFGVDIPYSEPDLTTGAATSKFQMDLPSRRIDKKNEYTLTELAIFKLCPKLYYHRQTDDNAGVYLTRLQLKFYLEAVLYCNVFIRFIDYNLANKKVYHKNAAEHEAVIAELFKESCTVNAKYFSFFNQYEIEDAIRNVSGKTRSFFENAKKNLKGNTFTVIDHKNKRYKCDGFELVIEHDNRVVDYEKKTWRMSQNIIYLEFVVLKTSDNKSELTHYADMIKALDENDQNEDRINLIARVIAKINIQFDSKRFAGDGVTRANDLVRQVCDYDFSAAAVMESEYCSFCRLIDVCMGR